MNPRLVFATSILILTFGCDKKQEDARSDPAPTSVAASVSASVKATPAPPPPLTPSELAKAGRCNDGVLVAQAPPPAAPSGDAGAAGAMADGDAGDEFGLGGLGLSGTGSGGGFGYVEGIGPPSVVVPRLSGSVVSVEGRLDPAALGKAMCGGSDAIRACFRAESKTTPTGALTINFVVADDGHVEKIVGSAGTLTAAPLVACVSAAVQKLAFDKSSGRASVGYTFDYVQRPPTVKLTATGETISGRLPPEVVKRIVRQNFPRIRACYQQGLKRDPSLHGSISARFVIDETGAVTSLAAGPGATLVDAGVSSCILGVFRSLSFPEPEGGKVTVTYPIAFQSD